MASTKVSPVEIVLVPTFLPPKSAGGYKGAQPRIAIGSPLCAMPRSCLLDHVLLFLKSSVENDKMNGNGKNMNSIKR